MKKLIIQKVDPYSITNLYISYVLLYSKFSTFSVLPHSQHLMSFRRNVFCTHCPYFYLMFSLL
ncbi:hypothetical protein C0J52_15790 [Blattella germanica]|nr:hypothetical protein C0J52_15790 [Blattella germanica]